MDIFALVPLGLRRLLTFMDDALETYNQQQLAHKVWTCRIILPIQLKVSRALTNDREQSTCHGSTGNEGQDNNP